MIKITVRTRLFAGDDLNSSFKNEYYGEFIKRFLHDDICFTGEFPGFSRKKINKYTGYEILKAGKQVTIEIMNKAIEEAEKRGDLNDTKKT